MVKIPRLAIFVDGENFLFAIRKLFSSEFDRSDYFPRDAQWSWFFGRMASYLGAKQYHTYWYTVDEIDFFPYGKWDTDTDQIVEQNMRHSKSVREELDRAKSRGDKDQLVAQYRANFIAQQEKMEKRLAGWHELQDQVENENPGLQFRRVGWQMYYLAEHSLGKEKGVDIGLAVDLVCQKDHYDTAVLISGDGDFVPAVKEMKKLGKRIGNIEFVDRNGRAVTKIARRLSQAVDFQFSVPFDDMVQFMGIQPSPEGGKPAKKKKSKSSS